MNIIIKNKNKGFSLVEIIVAISVFLIFLIATVNITGSSIKQLQGSTNKERAAALAEEGLEAVRNIRDNNFNNLVDGTYGLSSAGEWNFSGTSDVNGIFNREIIISTINSNQKKIISKITWADQMSPTNSITLNTYLTNWQAVLNIGLTIDKVVINHGGTKVPDDFLPINLSTLAWDNTVDPPVQNNINIPIIFSPTTMTLSDGTYNFLTTTDPDYGLTLSSSCVGNVITLVGGDAKICTITYEENVAPTVDTPTSTNITQNTATLGATVSSLGVPATISARGICYNTAGNPTLTNGATCVAATLDQTLTPYTVNVTGLTSSITYKYAGYATNAKGTAYSTDGTFDTTSSNIIPTVTTPTVASVGTSTVVLGANVTSLGIPASITARGTCWGTTAAPTTNCIAEGGTTAGIFTQSRNGFTAGTLYYYRGYATNATGTAYSADGTFTTLAMCTSSIVGVPTVYNSAGSVSAVVTKPTGVVVGDIMFAHILHFNSTDRLSVIPSGWLPFDGATGRHKNGNYNQALYYKVATVSEGANYTFGLSSSSKFAITISAYRGCFNTTSPINASSNVEYISNNATYRAASMNLTSPYATVLMFPSIYNTAVRTFANPTTQGGGWTEDYDHGNNAPDFSRAGYRKMITASGATGFIDSIGTSGTTIKHAFAVALNPL